MYNYNIYIYISYYFISFLPELQDSSTWYLRDVFPFKRLVESKLPKAIPAEEGDLSSERSDAVRRGPTELRRTKSRPSRSLPDIFL